jgi:outer membrane protein assembly factor BamB
MPPISNDPRVAAICGARAVLLLLLLAQGRAGADDWPHWRGPLRNDLLQESSGWKDGRWAAEKPLWQADVGEGSTSPLVVGGRLYVMGWKGGEDHVHCLEAKTGKSLWTSAYKCPPYGRYASGDQFACSGPTSTPEYDTATGYLYTLSADGDLNCWDTAPRAKRCGASICTSAFP